MKNFNENPFKKDTPVSVFSNGSEFVGWKFVNCDKCINYESESDKEENAKCKLAFHLDYGTILGKIPLWVAKEIGCKYDPLYLNARLYIRCRKFSDGDEPF